MTSPSKKRNEYEYFVVKVKMPDNVGIREMMRRISCAIGFWSIGTRHFTVKRLQPPKIGKSRPIVREGLIDR